MKLYGKEREIVLGICGKTRKDAYDFIYDNYYVVDENALKGGYFPREIEDVLRSLKDKKFISFSSTLGNMISGFQVLNNCRSYPEMEDNYNKANQSGNDYSNNHGNIIVAGCDVTNANQSVAINTSASNIFRVINDLRAELDSTQVCADVKGDVNDELDNIEREFKAATPDSDRLKRFMRKLVDKIKDVTALSTLMVHYKTLEPLIIEFIRSTMTSSCR